MATARRVVDRFNAVDGGLLAAGLAYNAVLALIPIALVVTALAGFVLNDPDSRTRFIEAVGTFAPPLIGVVDEIVRGLSKASTSLSVIGLVLAFWGASRLFASLESGVGQMFSGAPHRGFISRTIRRVGAIAVLAFILAAALIAIPILSVAGDMIRAAGAVESLFLTLAFVAIAFVLASVALAALFRVLPPLMPTWRQIRTPAVVTAVALLVITRGFTLIAPRLFGANVIYGTLGAIFLGLAWLDLVFTAILIGAAWVAIRSANEEAAVV